MPATQQELHELINIAQSLNRPVLSLYSMVQREQPDSAHALGSRVKNALRELEQEHNGGVPKGISEKLSDFLSSYKPQGHALALFVDAGRLLSAELELAIGEELTPDRAEVRLGEPYLTPLIVALKSLPNYAVVVCDRDHARCFEWSLGQATLVFESERPPVYTEADTKLGSQDRAPRAITRVNPKQAQSAQSMGNRQNMPKYIADRGDAAKQLADEHVTQAQYDFYRDVGKRLSSVMRERSLEHVILLGPTRDRHMLQSALAPRDAERVEALLPNINGNTPDAKRIAEHVLPTLERIRSEREQQLIETVVEKGVTGAEASLRALQEGRAHTLVVSRSIGQPVYLNQNTEYVSLKREEAERLDNGSQTSARRVDLMQVLPELAERWGAELRFVDVQRKAELEKSFSSIGALLRW